MSERYYADSNIKYCDRVEELPQNAEHSTEYWVMAYISGRIEKPVEFINKEISKASLEIQRANYALSRLGMCWTPEKRCQKRQLKEKRAQAEEYMLFLKKWANVRSHNELAFELFHTEYSFLKL